MKLGTKGRYAVMAVADIALFQKDGRVSLAEISTRQKISQSYLEQLLSRMRQAGIVKSIRGPGGGYRLAFLPSETKIFDVISAVDEVIEMTGCNITENISCTGKKGKCVGHCLWMALTDQIRNFLEEITIEDLIKEKIS